jgi:hypothetical protein
VTVYCLAGWGSDEKGIEAEKRGSLASQENNKRHRRSSSKASESASSFPVNNHAEAASCVVFLANFGCFLFVEICIVME